MGDDTDKIIEGYERYAKSKGFRLNPDRKAVELVVKGLLANQQAHGVRYCPCRIVTGDREKDRKIICPCAYHAEEIKRDGHCHCRLFVR